ncbi:MAG TPA: dTMP kinase, partial [Corynebacterium sp.]|nr:dTMP kinase [Corynebacterium sp.]
MIIAVEGIDGAGKNTLVTVLRREVGAEVLSFPRYEASIHAQLAQEALHGRMGDLTDSAYAMATLFALDRHGSREQLAEYVDSGRVLLLDRYVASNAAYSLARTGEESVVDWVAELEFERLGLPRPDLQVLL